MNFKNKHEVNNKTVNLHEGHRSRVRKRLTSTQFVDADEYQVVEYILQLVIRRKDTNEIAHRLIDSFGSLANLCDADIEDIMSVSGVSNTVATFLHSVPYIFRNYKISKLNPKANLSCPQDLFNYLGECIYHSLREEFYIVCLDSGNNVINQRIISVGSISQVSIKIKDVIRFAMSVNAHKVILLHNHPTCDAEPSIEDIDTTKKLYLNLRLNGISLDDHIIVNYQAKYYSFAHNGWMNKFAEESKGII